MLKWLTLPIIASSIALEGVPVSSQEEGQSHQRIILRISLKKSSGFMGQESGFMGQGVSGSSAQYGKYLELWYTRQDSNLRHPASKAGALSS